MKAEIRAAWCPNVFRLVEVFGTELLFHRPIRRIKIKISSKSVLPVVLISSSTGESEGSNNLNKHSANRFHLFIMLIVSAVSQVSVAIQRPSLGQVFGLVISTFLNWIPLGYIFETNLISTLIYKVNFTIRLI